MCKTYLLDRRNDDDSENVGRRVTVRRGGVVRFSTDGSVEKDGVKKINK